MMKFISTTLFISLFLTVHTGFAQEAFTMNVFIDADKNIFLEDEKVSIGELAFQARERIYNQPAIKYNRVVFKIYADKNLKHGLIMDVNHHLEKGAKSLGSKTKKYLLEYKNIHSDQPAWQEEIKNLKLKAIRD